MWLEELVCSRCQRLRHRGEFADSEIRVKPNERICVDCGMTSQRGKRGYSLGTYLAINSTQYVWCVGCGMFTCEVGCWGQCAECEGRTSKEFIFDLKMERAWKRARRGIAKKGGGFEIEGRFGNWSEWQPESPWDRNIPYWYISEHEEMEYWVSCDWFS